MEGDADFLYQIRDLMINDLDQYNALLCYAFQVTEQQLMRVGWRNEDIKQSKFPIPERIDILDDTMATSWCPSSPCAPADEHSQRGLLYRIYHQRYHVPEVLQAQDHA